VPIQLVQPSEALSGKFDSPAVEENYQSKKMATIERRHGFWVGNIGLLLPPDIISEVSEGLAICRLPNASRWLVGMSNLRGNMVPVFDLSILFNLQIEEIENRKLLFLKIDDDWVGVYSDRLPVRINLDKEKKLNDIPPVPSELRSFVKMGYQQTDIWLDWDIKDFFSWLAEQTHN